MTIQLTREEASLARYALRELAYRRCEQVTNGRKLNSKWADANEKEAKTLFALADRITEIERQVTQ